MRKKNHMPPVPPGNRNDAFPGNDTKPKQDTTLKHSEPENPAEQGETANIKQNTTNAGSFTVGGSSNLDPPSGVMPGLVPAIHDFLRY